MLPATTLTEVEWLLSRSASSAIPNKRRMLGLLFARPSIELAKNQIFPNLEFFDRRSLTHIDVFCAGVARGKLSIADLQFPAHDYIAATAPDPAYRHFRDYESSSGFLYSDAAFCTFCDELESKTSWRYSGETDLLFLDCEIGESRANIDFTQVIAMNLDEMFREGLFASVSAFFENVIAAVKPTNVGGKKTVSGLSDALGGRAITKITYDSLMKLLPARANQAATAIRYLRVTDVARD